MSAWFEGLLPPGYATAVLVILGALMLLVIVLFVVSRLRKMGPGTFVAGGRNRRARLAVMDAAAVDSRRRLVLVRRDDMEHLILIGGPTDVVIEQNIRMVTPGRRHTDPQPEAPAISEPVSPPARETAQETPRPRLVPPPPPPRPAAKAPEPVTPAAARPDNRYPSPPDVPTPQQPVRPTPPAAAPRPAVVAPMPTPEPRVAPAAEQSRQTPGVPPRQEPSFARQEPEFARQESKPADNVVTPIPLAKVSTPDVASERRDAEPSRPDPELTPKEAERRDVGPGPSPTSEAGPDEISLEEEMSRLLGDLSGERR